MRYYESILLLSCSLAPGPAFSGWWPPTWPPPPSHRQNTTPHYSEIGGITLEANIMVNSFTCQHPEQASPGSQWTELSNQWHDFYLLHSLSPHLSHCQKAPHQATVFLVKECAESPPRNVMIDPERRDDRILSCIDHIVSGQTHTNIFCPHVLLVRRLTLKIKFKFIPGIRNSNWLSLLQGRPL